MARPRIGVFGALIAVGGMIAWRWAQKHRASQARLAGELSRWEGEGGAVVSQAASAASAAAPSPERSGPKVVPNGAGHGAFGQVGGTRDAWIFPHGHS
ncbi:MULTISPECIES: hypothetical protein [unclassified Trinickia]|uniref:hypothetical protein n=1 Tax=unclassified Trinickia TaxID=2638168 RepID=UPI002404B532|nr:MULTISPECIES: hypothetical protein [unclassified Trinickia]MDG0025936.1 hypothetical protein [Trinickia sp. Y13]HVW53000.1 hypothetical protein [Trinickia sp.]